MEKVEKHRAFLINFFYMVVIALILYVVFKYALFWFMPFLIGFFVAFLLKPLINKISNRTGRRKLVSVVIVLLFYGTVGVLLTFAGIRLFVALKDLFLSLPEFYSDTIEPSLVALSQNLTVMFNRLDPSLLEALQELTQNLSQVMGTAVSKLSSGAISVISGVATSVPGALVGVLFSILSSFFIAGDYYQITGFLLRQFGPRGRELIFETKEYIVGTLFQILKGYGKIMCVTFLELLIGLTVLRIDNAPAIALFIAVFDILPVFGTGGIMIPWAVFTLISGNYGLALGLVIVYVLITLMRNIIEPKIIGGQIGLHPLLMLMSMFLGVKLFGFLGIFLFPLTVVIVKNLNDSGKIHLYKA